MIQSHSLSQPADSYYQHSRNQFTQYATEITQQEADVVVIGGGITGCSTALNLAKKGINVVVLEANSYGWGASGRSGGQIINGFSTEMDQVERLMGLHSARKLWQHSLQSVSYTRQLVKDFNIECDMTMGYLHAANKARQSSEMARWVESMANQYDYHDLTFLDRSELKHYLNTDKYYAAVHDTNSGHLHPLNYCLGVVNAAQQMGAKLYQDARVRKVENKGDHKYVYVGDKVIRCDQVVYACNAYMEGLCKEIDTHIMPVGTYIVATEQLSDEVAASLIPSRAAVSDSNFVLDYYRLSADNRMLFGGRVSYSTREPTKLDDSLKKRMLEVFPQLHSAQIEFSWGGHVAITINRLPHVGRTNDGHWFAHGYSGHGMAISGYMGKLLADAVNGDNNDIQDFVQIPHQAFPGGRRLRMPLLVLAMSYYRMRDYF